MLLCSVQQPTYPAVYPLMDLSGTFLMEVQSNVLRLYHTTELGLIMDMLVVEQYVSTVTLRLPQQESSTVTYLTPVETFRAFMWEYIMPPQVSPKQRGRQPTLVDLGVCSSEKFVSMRSDLRSPLAEYALHIHSTVYV